MLRGFAFGLRFGTLWVVADCLWLTVEDPGLGWRLLAMSLAAATPAMLVLALGCGLVALGWRDHRVVRWLGDDAAVRLTLLRPSVARSAWLVAGLGLALAAFGVSVALGTRVWSRVATPWLGVALLLFIAMAATVVAVLLAPVSQRGVETMLAPLARTRGAVLVSPLAVVVAAGAAALAALFWGLSGNLLAALPWRHALAPLVALLGTAGLEVRLANSPRVAARVGTAHAVGLGLVMLAGMGLPARDAGWHEQLMRHRSAARAAFGLTRVIFDFDGDGELSLFGEHDCAAFDATRHPDRLEIANNGVDEDCSGRDLNRGEGTVSFGISRHGKPPDMATRPHILLITTDALSYRHTGFGGHVRRLTPELDAFAARATAFDNAFSVGPETATAFPALFTGRYPSEVPSMCGWLRPSPDVPAAPTLATQLRGLGYRTHAIVGSRIFAGWPHLTRGFQTIDASAVDEAEQRRRRPKAHSSQELTAHAIRVVQAEHAEPLFLWVHYFDHHPPYALPLGEEAVGDGTSDEDRYDTELRYSDRAWGALLRAVEARWAEDEYVLLFTADHGEAFDANHQGGEHHAHCLRSAETHVPFIVQGPRRRGDRVPGLVSHLDVVPTLLDVAGSDATTTLRGESLIPVLFDGADVAKTVVVSSFFNPETEPSFRQVAVRTSQLLFLHDRERHVAELYAWPTDRLDTTDVSASHAAEAEIARDLARRHVRGLFD